MDSFVANFEAGGHRYFVAPIDAIRQFHMARKLGPLLIPVLPMLIHLWGDGKKLELSDVLKELATYLPDALTAFSQMPYEDSEFVLFTCLDAVYRKQETGNARVRVNGSLMFNDIKLPAMLQIAYEVIKANLGDFIDTGLLKGSTAGGAA